MSAPKAPLNNATSTDFFHSFLVLTNKLVRRRVAVHSDTFHLAKFSVKKDMGLYARAGTIIINGHDIQRKIMKIQRIVIILTPINDRLIDRG